jgi:hypothetical protein
VAAISAHDPGHEWILVAGRLFKKGLEAGFLIVFLGE